MLRKLCNPCPRRVLGLSALLLTPLASAEAGELLRLDDPSKYELQAVGFELNSSTTIDVDALGLRPRHADDLSVYAWILDSETRKPVWEMTRRKSKRERGSRVLRRTQASVELDPGRYELYFFGGPIVERQLVGQYF